MNIKQVHNVYFIGIGGIGMSALARYFKYLGKNVAGYDKTATPLTKELQESGITICFDDAVKNIPDDHKDAVTTLVVYTPAVPTSHLQYQYFKEREFTIMKRAAVLGLLTNSTYCFAVAGTHGKTTTSSILAHLLNECNVPITAFLGGISENFNSNFLIKGSDYTVVEADEFDRSFLHLHPTVACITSMDADHLDIYGTADALTNTFVEFSKNVKPEGKLIVKSGLPINGLTYGIEDNSDYCVENLQVKNGSYVFNIKTPKAYIENVVFNKPGRHNLLNALAAFAMVKQLDVDTNLLVGAMNSFKGVERRFSYHIKKDDLVLIDDYAHHPTEINALHQAVREMYPGKQVLAIFQPHLFSRTKDFVDEFAESLSKFDEIILLDIYPAREEPIEGVTSAWVLEKIENQHKKLVSKSMLINEVLASKANVIVTVGAGDISAEVPKIKQALLAS
jgi:UDP-N-acetylmuramate--alanine ligase